MRQTVLDLRWATAWMESRPEIDKARLGIMGTSLGSFVAALTAEMDDPAEVYVSSVRMTVRMAKTHPQIAKILTDAFDRYCSSLQG